MSEAVERRLLQLVGRSDASNITEVIRRALALYDQLLEIQESGGQFHVKRRDGSQERIIIV